MTRPLPTPDVPADPPSPVDVAPIWADALMAAVNRLDAKVTRLLDIVEPKAGRRPIVDPRRLQ